MSPGELQRVVAEARARLAERAAAKTGVQKAVQIVTAAEILGKSTVTPAQAIAWSWNAEQVQAINNGLVGKSFCLIGAAGTGKTTTLRGLLKAKLESNTLPMLESGTENLVIGSPGVVLVSFTRRAVRNIARQMPDDLRKQCLTIHRLLEFAPEHYVDTNEQGQEVRKMRFAPTRHNGNPLPENLRTVVIDESSMVSIELFELLLDALPYPARVQFIFLGDLNQLPPVYGHPILGQKLLQLPIVELTQVYRQALESPIIALALAVKNNDFKSFNRMAVEEWSEKFRKIDGKPDYLKFDAKHVKEIVRLEKPGRGIVTLHPWKKKVETEVGLAYMQGQLKQWIDRKVYDPLEDLVLCPWNKSFGTDELNRAIADKLGKDRGAVIHEIIAGYNTYYYAIGDKLMIDKQEAIIVDVYKNPKYFGKRPAQPSEKMDRWGNHADRSILSSDLSDIDVDALLESISMDEERSTAASHVVRYRYLDAELEWSMDKAAQFNTSSFGYAITVHKAQGSECRKVFVLTHFCHSAMLFRELIYTAITRAAEEIYIVMSPMMLGTAAERPRIKGDTLVDKLSFYAERLKERISNDG